MLEVEEGVVLHAQVAQDEGHAGPILCGGSHHDGPQLGYLDVAWLLRCCCFVLL